MKRRKMKMEENIIKRELDGEAHEADNDTTGTDTCSQAEVDAEKKSRTDMEEPEPVYAAANNEVNDNDLTNEEKDILKRCEVAIEEGKSAYLEVGKALVEIHEKRLYRIGYKSFREYCEKKWKFSRSYAYRLMRFCEEASEASPIGKTSGISNEHQARQLRKVPKEKRAEVIIEAKRLAGDKEMSGTHIQAATVKVCGQKSETAPKLETTVDAGMEEQAPVVEEQHKIAVMPSREAHAVVKIPTLKELLAVAEELYAIQGSKNRSKEAMLIGSLRDGLKLHVDMENPSAIAA